MLRFLKVLFYQAMLLLVWWMLLYTKLAAGYDERVFDTFDIPVQTYSVKRGENITLSCPALYQNSLVFDVDWLMVRGKKNLAHYENKTGIITWMEIDPRKTLVKNFGLHIAMVTSADSGDYICIFNARTIPESVSRLIVQDVPDPPGRPMFVKFTSRSIKISWAPSRNTHASPVTHYIIHMRIGEESDWLNDQILTLDNKTYYEVLGLEPYTVYSFRILAVNAMGASLPGLESFYMVTLRELPAGVATIGEEVKRSSSSIRINWEVPDNETINGEFVGYRLRYKERDVKNAKTKEVYICNPTTKEFLIQNLTTYTRYWISLQVLNPEGLGPAYSIFDKTDEGLPGPPQNLTVTEVGSQVLELSWIEPERPNGIITSYCVYYVNANLTSVQTFKWESGINVRYNLTNLEPDKEYAIHVKASTAKNLGNSSDPIISKTDINGPSAPTILTLECQLNDIIFIKWERPKTYFYTIDYYYLYVYIGDEFYMYDNVTIQTTKDHLEISYSFPNVTTDSVYRIQIVAATFSKYTNQLIYGEESEIKEVYINKKCEKRRKFLRRASGELDFGLIAGISIAAFAFVVGISAFMIWGTFFRDAYYYLDDVPCSFPSSCLDWHSSSSDNDRKEAIPVDRFSSHVAELHADGDIGFSKEYEVIQINKVNYSSAHSKSEENRAKNRYLNITAYDHTRVLLSIEPSEEKDPTEPNLIVVKEPEYINANYIDGFEITKAYIGTQGPLPTTFDCFWRMIWEQRVTIIVMITNLVERGRRKCDMYWPKPKKVEIYGVIRVEWEGELIMATHTVRTFSICHISGGEQKKVYQYHYTSWPDHGTPDHPLPVLNFVEKSSAANEDPLADGGPIVVHCSAGVGRTGTYIVLDSMLQQIRTTNQINIFGFLQHIRTQRNFLVQTEEQYIFIHDALVEAIQSGETNIAREDFSEYVEFLKSNTSDNKNQWKSLEELYRLITSCKCQDFNYASANKVINEPKNRGNLKPIENWRVHLIPKPGEDGSDYINATWLQGFRALRQYIITPHPMKHTVNDFWQMVWDHNVNTVMVLNTIDEEFTDFWPRGTEMLLQTDAYKMHIKQEFTHPRYHRIDYIMTSLQDDYELIVAFLYYPNWYSATPLTELFTVHEDLHVTRQGEVHNGPVCVIDRNGGTEAATFCALSTLRLQLLVDKSVDVYMIAKLYHMRRPGIWPTAEDYLQLNIAIEALSSSNINTCHELLYPEEARKSPVSDGARCSPDGMETTGPNLAVD